MLSEKVVCKKCKEEITSMEDVGFLLLMKDPDTCPQCEMEIAGTSDHFDHYCGKKGGRYNLTGKQAEDKLLCMPCMRCIRTAIHCKKCGQKTLVTQIQAYQEGTTLFEVAKDMKGWW